MSIYLSWNSSHLLSNRSPLHSPHVRCALTSYHSQSHRSNRGHQRQVQKFLARKLHIMASSRSVRFFLLLLIARGSSEGSGLAAEDLQSGSDINFPRARTLRPVFPFVNGPIPLPLPPDADQHPFMRLKVMRKNSSDLDHLRIFIWPNAGNCNTTGRQLTNGVMRQKATFIVETAKYKDGLCMTATQEIDPNSYRSLWTLAPPSKLHIDSFNTSFDIILEGNGTFVEWHLATWFVIVGYIVFCTLFFLLWYHLMFPGHAM